MIMRVRDVDVQQNKIFVQKLKHRLGSVNAIIQSALLVQSNNKKVSLMDNTKPQENKLNSGHPSLEAVLCTHVCCFDLKRKIFGATTRFNQSFGGDYKTGDFTAILQSYRVGQIKRTL